MSGSGHNSGLRILEMLACVLLVRAIMGSLVPTQPDQVCETVATRWSETFVLPEGLVAGERVRTVRAEEGYWIVEDLERPGRSWRLPAFLLQLV